jgi:hypothetical protein
MLCNKLSLLQSSLLLSQESVEHYFRDGYQDLDHH